MDERELIKLNNYDFSKNNLEDVKRYLTTGETPKYDFSHYYKVKKFKDRWNANDWEFKGEYLIYKPNGLTVIPTEEQEEFLEELYKDPEIGIGKGIQSLYDKVLEYNILGISRSKVKKFLEGQSSYQLTKPERKPINKPIITRFPNERWSADLIDMKSYSGHNKQQKWILTVIDNFSKFVFATPLLRKTANQAIEGFERIVNEQAKGTYPQVLQTDNGGEFENKIFIDWAKEHNISIRRSASYQPTSNASVENFNNILRKMIREGYVRNNSLNWVDHLQTYINNRNNTKHSTTKYKPVDLWRTGRKAFNTEDANTPIEIKEVKERIEDKARKDMAKFKSEAYKVGDKVRVSYASINSKVRMLIEQGDKKYVPVKFTPNIYTIAKVKAPRGRDAEFIKTRYTLYDSAGNEKLREFKANNPNKERKPQVFFATELQRVVDKPDDKHITQRDADKLNKVKSDYDEIQIKKGIEPNSFKDDDEEEEPKVIQTRSQTKPKPKYSLRSRKV